MFGFLKKIFGGSSDTAVVEAPPQEDKSLFDKIGGEGAVDAAVDLFYRKVLADEELAPFFEATDMEEQHKKQKAFLTMAFGGPNNYTGADMTKAHAKLVKQGMGEKHFDLVMSHLGATLTELEVPADLIKQAADIALSVKGDVLKGEPEEEKSEEAPEEGKTLFDKIGGEGAVDAAVDLFYRKVLADEELAPFFEATDMEEQHKKQKAFLTMAFGGPNNYTGADMTKAHAKLVKQGMGEKHFDLVMKHLGETLVELNVPGELISKAADIALSVKDDVLKGEPEEEKPEEEKPEEAPAEEKKSLFENIGGEGAVDAAVDLFYRKVLADEELAPFFEATDMEEQHKKQKAFLTMAFGGPNNYTGADMTKAHAKLVKQGMGEKHFNLVMQHLGDTLVELKVPEELITQAANIALSVKDDVLKGE